MRRIFSVLTTATAIAALAPALAEEQVPQHDFSAVRSWGYQLQAPRIDELAETAFDVLVIDHSEDGSLEGRFTPDDIAALQVKPDGSDRIVLSYLSIGEAEDYRVYWQATWDETPPSWLGRENPEWAGNYAIRYWDPAWKAIIFGSDTAFLDVIIEQGFDGVYLDKVDGYFDWDGETAIADMKQFVAEISAYAKSIDPDFLIIQQNAEDLMSDPAHVAVIDGLAKESLLYNVDEWGTRNSDDLIDWSSARFDELRAQGDKLSLVVEYLLTEDQKHAAMADAAASGLVITFAEPDLATLPEDNPIAR